MLQVGVEIKSFKTETIAMHLSLKVLKEISVHSVQQYHPLNNNITVVLDIIHCHCTARVQTVYIVQYSVVVCLSQSDKWPCQDSAQRRAWRGI